MSQDFGKIEQKDVLCSFKTASLIATYEELLQVPEAERITHYFGDYGGHFFNDGVADSQIDAAYEKALAAGCGTVCCPRHSRLGPRYSSLPQNPTEAPVISACGEASSKALTLTA